jgi:uncharacterized membrane-anchored protein YjiN (DUF445 family)
MTDNRTCLRQQIIDALLTFVDNTEVEATYYANELMKDEEIASRWLEWYWNHGAKHGAVRSKSQMRRTVAMVS